MNESFIKSPLNYICGKYKILSQIVPLFLKDINCFVDLFVGEANVGLNVKAKKIVLNDNLTYVIDLYRKLQITSREKVLEYIYNRIDKHALSLQIYQFEEGIQQDKKSVRFICSNCLFF
ncbi:MAG: DNA adenine methylase [Endomicrobium sp.]|nr:DNA adenine methylase [Endomicrobium sp.]